MLLLFREHLGEQLPGVVALLVHRLSPDHLDLRVVNGETLLLLSSSLDSLGLRDLGRLARPEVNEGVVFGLANTLYLLGT